AYRLVELKRFSEHLGLPLNLQPTFFPVSSDDAARLVIAVDLHDGVDAAMALTDAVMCGVWAEQRDIADADTLASMLTSVGVPTSRAADARGSDVQALYDAHTQQAIDLGVFGAPTYVIDGELFWGQDRLDFVERRLSKDGRTTPS
ncbi:MAG: DsbA family protein, partial [Caldimonas sp.]